MRSFRRLVRSKKYIYFWMILILIFILYNEVFSYYFNAKKWNELKCKNTKDCLKILLVADPQIIGNTQEVIHFLTPLNIFDSDRYLKKTYSHALAFVKPDVVIFLGDLMDEAHIATNQEFYQYVRRIFNIFLGDWRSSENIRHIWLPGDNDIGGEDTSVTPNKLERFDRAFSQPNIISIKNITFFKVNRLTSTIPIYKNERDFYDSSKMFVGLSHIPLMFKPSVFVDKVVSKMFPHLLFTAHEHKSMIISTNALSRNEFKIIPITQDNNQVFEYTLGASDIYEILIPTCSYRMGTTEIGYGSAIIAFKKLKTQTANKCLHLRDNNYFTRNKHTLLPDLHSTALYQKRALFNGCPFYNMLPEEIEHCFDQLILKKVKDYNLLINPYYASEFIDYHSNLKFPYL